MTELASGAITAVDTVTIEAGGADETPASLSSDGLPRQPCLTRTVFRLARILLPASSPPPS